MIGKIMRFIPNAKTQKEMFQQPKPKDEQKKRSAWVSVGNGKAIKIKPKNVND